MVGCGQVFLLSNQIVGLFDPQYIWKESIINGREHLGLPVLVGHLCLLSKQIAVFPNKQYLWKELIDILDDFHGDIHQFWLVEARHASGPIKFRDFLIASIFRRNELIPLSDYKPKKPNLIQGNKPSFSEIGEFSQFGIESFSLVSGA